MDSSRSCSCETADQPRTDGIGSLGPNEEITKNNHFAFNLGSIGCDVVAAHKEGNGIIGSSAFETSTGSLREDSFVSNGLTDPVTKISETGRSNGGRSRAWFVLAFACLGYPLTSIIGTGTSFGP